jgi:hypothetical protein
MERLVTKFLLFVLLTSCAQGSGQPLNCESLSFRLKETSRALKDPTEPRDIFARHALRLASDINRCRGVQMIDELEILRQRQMYDAMATLLDGVK